MGRSTRDQRMRVLRRDGYRCVYCGWKADREEERASLTMDHFIPLSKGGRTIASNLRTACGRCNHDKGNRIFKIDPLTGKSR